MSEKEIDIGNIESNKIQTLDKGIRFHRILRLPELFAIGYGDVGSSIYYALGLTIAFALGATPIALMIAGVTFVCTVLTYAELSSAIPESGGTSSYARYAFNDLVSFIAGWALLLDYIVTIAISAYEVGPYLGYFFPYLKTGSGSIIFGIIIIAILLCLNIFGIRKSTKISLILVLLNTSVQLIIIAISIFAFFNIGTLWEHMRIGIPNVDWSPTWHQFFKGIGIAMVAYIGIESMAQLASETKSPEKTIPRAMFLSMFTLLIMYFGISAVTLSIYADKIPYFLENYKMDPIAGIVAAMPIGSSILAPIVGILGAVILFVASNAGLIGASRLTYTMGELIQLPRFFYSLSRFKTPHISLVFFAILAILVIVCAKDLHTIADLYNFGAMLAFSLAHLSLIGLRIKKPNLKRPFKIPFNIKIKGYEIPISSIIGLLATFAVWIDVIITKPSGRNLGFIWMFLGITSFIWYRRKKRLKAATQIQVEKIKVPEYHDTAVDQLLVPVQNVNLFKVIQHIARFANINHAKIIALHVIEMPIGLPLDTFFPDKFLVADHLLKQAKAVAREYNIQIETHIVQSRSFEDSVIEIADKHKCDMILLGTTKIEATKDSINIKSNNTYEKIIKNTHAQVMLFLY